MKQLRRKIAIKNFEINETTQKINVLAGNMITLKDAAKILGYSYGSLYKHHKDSGMPPFLLRRNRILYNYDDLVKWMEHFEKITP